MTNPADKQSVAWQAKEELIKTYTDREKDLQFVIEKKDKIIDEMRKKIRALKRYGREVKYLAEDWSPRG